MMSAFSIINIKAGEKMAQLLLLPYKQRGHTAPVKRTGGFGSTGTKVFWHTVLGDQRPQLTVMFPEGIKITGLVDSGADVTIVSTLHWPQSWPVHKVNATFTGLGTLAEILQSSNVPECQGPEGQKGKIQPYVASIALSLWGRDLLQQWGATITIPSLPKGHRQMICQAGADVTGASVQDQNL